MKVSDNGLMFLIGHEGIVQSRYKDAVGVWTIGVGHTAAAGPPDPAKFAGTMTMREVFDLLRRDVAKYEAAVSNAVKVALEQHEFDALVSWHYNTGRIAKATWLKALNDGRKAAAFAALETSITTAGGKKLQALVDRRKAESALARTGVYPPPVAMLYPASPQGKVLWSKGKQIDLVRALQTGAASEPKPAVAPSGPSLPETAPAASPVPAKGIAAGFAAALIALVAGLFWSGACLAPDFIINWLGYAGRCAGAN